MNILLIEKSKTDGERIRKFFKSKGHSTDLCNKGLESLQKLRENSYDIIFLALNTPDIDGVELLEKIKILANKTRVLITSMDDEVEVVVKCIKKGAFDYLIKPLHQEELMDALTDMEKKHTHDRANHHYFVRGVSDHSKTVEKRINLVAPTNMTVLIQGETGTGKEYVAKEIHRKSDRKDRPFIAVDCGALPNNIAGSELFGHEKGAFTGALKAKQGSFEAADTGTLFLDEIGNLKYENQVRLLRAIQERKVKRIGSNKQIPVDVRILVATNENLKEMVANGDFREDLFHRINEFDITIMPLKDRKEDIPLFVNHFLKLANNSLKRRVETVSESALDKLVEYHWPGNLRELRNILKKSVLLSDGNRIDGEDLPKTILLNKEFKKDENPIMATDLKSAAEMAEKTAIINALNETNNNKTEAAKILKVDRKTLYNKIKSFGIDQ